MTTKKSTNGLHKKEQELKEKLGTLIGKKNEEQKCLVTKQKLKKHGLSNKETKTLRKSKKSSDEKISKKSKKDSTRRAKFCSQQRTIGNIEMPKKKEKKIKNQSAKQEIFENSKFEVSNYHSTRLTISATHTPLEVNLKKKSDVILKLPTIVVKSKWKGKVEEDDEDDTLFNIDPIMPDMDLPSLRLNNKTE